ncbi:MAG: 3-methyl-2-oxobutanoate hydroxymethyltransferase [Alphaproteobacteria bacterium]
MLIVAAILMATTLDWTLEVSIPVRTKRMSIPDIRARKGGSPLVCLTAYTAPIASILDSRVDVLLVGDSLGMVIYGMDDTLAVTLDMMIAHGKAVTRAARTAFIVVDLPFGSYEASPEQAFHSAARVMAETSCQAVKLEGGVEMADTIKFLSQRGIPVMAHIGLMPQSVNATGGFRAQGLSAETATQIEKDGHAIAEAGAFSVVIEGTAEPVARRLTEQLDIPTIGIGASPACDGQILVTDDVIGLFSDFKPRFVKRYAAIGDAIAEAADAYGEEVGARRFPSLEHCYGVAK